MAGAVRDESAREVTLQHSAHLREYFPITTPWLEVSPYMRNVGGLSLLVLSVLAVTCAKPASEGESPTQIRTEVEALVRSIATAYNNSDASAAMDVYRRDDPSITSVTQGEIEHGWQQIRASTDSLVGTEGAIHVSTGNVDVTPLGPDYALAVTPMALTVKTTKGTVQLHVVMSIVARHDSTGWKVIHDHSSFQTPAQGPASQQ